MKFRTMFSICAFTLFSFSLFGPPAFFDGRFEDFGKGFFELFQSENGSELVEDELNENREKQSFMLRTLKQNLEAATSHSKSFEQLKQEEKELVIKDQFEQERLKAIAQQLAEFDKKMEGEFAFPSEKPPATAQEQQRSGGVMFFPSLDDVELHIRSSRNSGGQDAETRFHTGR